VEAGSREALKLVTAEAEIRGQGRAVVRRQGGATLVTCLAGRFLVQGGSSTVILEAGRGTVVLAGRAPAAPEAVAAAPSQGLWPGQDPAYAAPGEPLELRWEGSAPGYQLELLPVGSDIVLLQRDVRHRCASGSLGGAFGARRPATSRLEACPCDGLIAVDAKP
jgi:hypothetical protein